jgi:hypothetical protein
VHNTIHFTSAKQMSHFIAILRFKRAQYGNWFKNGAFTNRGTAYRVTLTADFVMLSPSVHAYIDTKNKALARKSVNRTAELQSLRFSLLLPLLWRFSVSFVFHQPDVGSAVSTWVPATRHYSTENRGDRIHRTSESHVTISSSWGAANTRGETGSGVQVPALYTAGCIYSIHL